MVSNYFSRLIGDDEMNPEAKESQLSEDHPGGQGATKEMRMLKHKSFTNALLMQGLMVALELWAAEISRAQAVP